MPQLFDEICGLVAEGHYLIGDHAWERLLERGNMEWQIIAGTAEARLIAERPLARPNPIVEMRVPLPNGDDCKVVWSLLRREGVAKLVTAHLLGDENFSEESWPMRIAGQRVKRTRLVQTDRLIVAVEVEMVIPESDPSEPCLESETVELLREVHEHAVEGDIAWLKTKGKVYQLVDAA